MLIMAAAYYARRRSEVRFIAKSGGGITVVVGVRHAR